MGLCLALAALMFGACGKKQEVPQGQGSAAAPRKGSAVAGDPSPGAASPAAGPGVSITSTVNPEVSGTYDRAFAKLANADEPTTIVFVRGCPGLRCTDNVFEIESIAQKCPTAFLATAVVEGSNPEPGDHMANLVVAGPAARSSTVTLAEVDLGLTAIGSETVAGSATQKTTESAVAGAFTAEVCGRM
ncbi:hypothetical protein BH11MYX1_BH11MYX1_14730 [soil metagenome]